MIDRERLSEIWRRHATKIIGAAVGFAVGLFIMWVGLFWTLVIALTTYAGYWVGARIEAGAGEMPEWLERLLPTGRR